MSLFGRTPLDESLQARAAPAAGTHEGEASRQRVIVVVIIAITLPILVHSAVRLMRAIPAPPKICCPTPESRAEYDNFYAHLQAFRRLLFPVAVSIGLIAIVVGAVTRRGAVGKGLIVGGIFTVVDGYQENRSRLPEEAWFASLAVAFIALAFIGYRALKRRPPNPRRLGYALLIGIVVTAAGMLPALRLVFVPRVLGLVFAPGLFVAIALGGSFGEPGPINEHMTLVLTVVASMAIWAVIAYFALGLRGRKETA